MSGSVNKVILVGNLGADPEVRQFQNGGQVCNLSVATSETWKDRNTGERQERTEWHRVSIFSEGLVKVAQNYLKKGSTVYVEGSLTTRKYTDQQGVEKYTTEVVIQRFNGNLTMLGGRGDGGGGGGGGRSDDDYGSGFSSGGQARSSGPKESYDLNDDIPF